MHIHLHNLSMLLGSSALALFFSNLSAHSIPRLLINHPLLKQPFIKVLEPYRLRHFSFSISVPIFVTLLLTDQRRFVKHSRYPNVCVSVICYYPPHTQSPSWVYGKQNFYAAKIPWNTGTSERAIFCATFQRTY